MKETVLSSWALLIWQALQAEGMDARKLFENAGLDPSKLSDGSARYEVDAMRELWLAIDQAQCPPGFGIEVGRRWSPRSFHALGYAWLASRNLGDALQRFCRYAKVVNTLLEVRLETRGLDTAVVFSTRNDWASQVPIVIDASFSALMTMCRMLVGEHFVPLAIRSPTLATDSRLLLERYLNMAVEYGCEQAEMLVARADMERDLPGGSAELLRVNDTLLQDYWAKLQQQDWAAQVRQGLMKLLPAGDCSEMAVAAQLNVSARTLQRRLAEQGLSFSQLLKDVRSEMADHYIRETRLSLNEVAYLLGFANQANFNRAFKRWYQCSPSEYRKGLAKIPA